MFDSTFISCPDRAFHHLLEMVTREFNAINGHPQWDVQYPTPEQPQHLSEAEYDQFVDDVAAEMEDQDARCCDHDECIICSQPDDDEDHCIVRPSGDDDPADYEDDEPACGDCGGCCECLGDPEVEPRFDTLHEQEEFYREVEAG